MAKIVLPQDGVMKKFNSMPFKNMVVKLWIALDYMEQYNGRSKEDCICLAMGYYLNNEGEWTTN